jgi:hypothetical protein
MCYREKVYSIVQAFGHHQVSYMPKREKQQISLMHRQQDAGRYSFLSQRPICPRARCMFST